MRNFLIILFVLIATSTQAAEIQTQDIQKKVIDILQEARNIVYQCDTRIDSLLVKVNALKTGYASDLSTADKQALVSVFDSIEAAGLQCGISTAVVDTNYPSIKE